MKLLLLDLEATCYEQGTEPQDFYSEIIEIGAGELDTNLLGVFKTFGTFVKPYLAINEKLSEFCTRLTTITDKDLIGAPSLFNAFQRLQEKFDLKEAVFSSWGDYDRNKIRRDCNKFKITYPFTTKHINLRMSYAQFYDVKKPGMDQALEQRGLDLIGTHHRGIDDVVNISCIVRAMIKDGWNPQDSVIIHNF